MHYYFKPKEDEIIKHQKVEDIKIPKSSKNESDKIKELGLTMEEKWALKIMKIFQE